MIGATAIKPKERKGFEAFSYFMYNPETGEVMGRTWLSWLKITIFYIIYYSFLAAFWIVMLIVFFQFVEDKTPRWIMGEGLIGSSPALGVRPKQADANIDSSIIMWRSDKVNKSDKYDVVPGYQEWVDRTNEFLQPYNAKSDMLYNKDTKEMEKTYPMDCTNGPLTLANLTAGRFCKFDIGHLGECSKMKNFGFDKGTPCLIIKLNKIFGLEHSYYTKEGDFPEDAPAKVKARMTKATDKNQVWMHCEGENAADKENLGEIDYYPKEAGFPSQYFPFMNQFGYQSPLVAVHLKNPKVGRLIHFECRAWAGNIEYKKRERMGRVHMEIMLHDATTADKVENVAKGIQDPPVKPRAGK